MSTSDPGSSGVLSPFAKTEDLYFDASYEPEDGTFEIEKEVREKFKEDDNVINILDNVKTSEEHFAMLELMESVNKTMTIQIRSIKD